MPHLSNTTSEFPVFLLTGFPGLEAFHIWISIPFFLLSTVTLLGNSMILLVVILEPNLHEPMYCFLFMLSATDLGLTLSTMPTTLSVLWFSAREIILNACIIQLFFLHSSGFMESSVLMAMAFDRFVAICRPLRYATILTDSRILKIGVAIVLRTLISLCPSLFLIKRLSFCKVNVLSHSYCFHPDALKVACSDSRMNSYGGLAVLILVTGVGTPCVALSYILIIHSVLNIISSEGRRKAFDTCGSHIGAVAVFYISWVVLSVVHRFFHKASPICPPTIVQHLFPWPLSAEPHHI
ncbi:olfactory receptor 51F1-like [Gorilla gorilla gorilla]|uniref:olfactory receptor 51F1-like n=1 Tax=Gorilla gorilla gorilla TaxID=9595 RepID=UPI0008F4E41B|nr:olfactory receptor 51F1-like [Gorilla gorilla gorilla]